MQWNIAGIKTKKSQNNSGICTMDGTVDGSRTEHSRNVLDGTKPET